MPTRPLPPCSAPGCPNLRPCPDHPVSSQPNYRGSSARQGYGAAWERLRARVLWEEPLCRECLAEGQVTAASDVDHIVPRPEGSDDRSNLQPLCRSHHSRKTRRENRSQPVAG